jgi:hypothetical protein
VLRCDIPYTGTERKILNQVNSSKLSIGKAMSFGEISKSSRSTGQPAARPISVDSISMLSSTLQSLQVGFIFQYHETQLTHFLSFVCV